MKKPSSNAAIWHLTGQKMAKVIFSGLFLASFANVAFAQAANDHTKIEPFGQPYAVAQAVPAKQARVFVYRDSRAAINLPVNIYLNGQYHASLLSGGFTEFCAAPGQVVVKTAVNDAQRLHLSKRDGGQKLPLAQGQTLFLKVAETASTVNGVVSGTQAQTQDDLLKTRRQIHTISRAQAAIACDETAVAAVQAPDEGPQREYALEADALFEFGKAELRASGFNAIEILIQKVRQDFSSVERIRVVGYTDPIGSTALNKKLSQARAEVVAKQISARQVQVTSGIQTEGRGSIELAKTGCGITPTPENIRCHAPNRRVMVVIIGARR